MNIETDRPTRDMKLLTPRAIVEELDRYIVGQKTAKRAMAIALRNRWRRQQVPNPLRDEITPKNILMIGPTGVGKTEIARRLAKLVQAPFVKLEASKFTEVGYVGRDVDSIVRDLVEISVGMVKEEERVKVRKQAQQAAEDRLLDILMPLPNRSSTGPSGSATKETSVEMGAAAGVETEESHTASREKLRSMLRAGKLNDRQVELELMDSQNPVVEAFGNTGIEQMGFDMSQLKNLFGAQGKRKKRKVLIVQALELLTQEEAEKLIDADKVHREAVQRAEQSGIVFLDEIDKIAGKESSRGPDVSREGVQRDLLPIVEGSTVQTKYGPVRTDHVLFVAAGAFHVSKPSDLIPELQGRFPIRVELDSLTQNDLVRILTEPENSLTRQYQALLATERVHIRWSAAAISELASLAMEANQRLENIGARRLHTILERVLDDLSFEASEIGAVGEREIEITPEYVRERVQHVLNDQDLSRYIL